MMSPLCLLTWLQARLAMQMALPTHQPQPRPSQCPMISLRESLQRCPQRRPGKLRTHCLAGYLPTPNGAESSAEPTLSPFYQSFTGAHYLESSQERV